MPEKCVHFLAEAGRPSTRLGVCRAFTRWEGTTCGGDKGACILSGQKQRALAAAQKHIAKSGERMGHRG